MSLINKLLSVILLLPSIVWADANSNQASPLFGDINGTNAGRYRSVKFTNGSTTNNNDGSISVVTGSSGGSGNVGIGTVNHFGGYVGISTIGPFQTVEVNGNVGIGGQVSPSYTLDTIGTQRMQNNAVSGTGGTITQFMGNQINTFTSNGTFTPGNSGTVAVWMCAGGGGGGYSGGGGGAGGCLYVGAYSVSAGIGVSVVVGTGGVGGNSPQQGGNGVDSTFGTLTAKGGGGAGFNGSVAGPPGYIGQDGGSGGGGGSNSSTIGSGAGGNATQTNPTGGTGYGNNGGASFDGSGGNVNAFGGGGGAGAVGANGTASAGGNGGTGQNSPINGTCYGGGGGGGALGVASAATGTCGGGNGQLSSGTACTAGTPNTGGGGGGGYATPACAGGSGIIQVSYPMGNQDVFNANEYLGLGTISPINQLDIYGSVGIGTQYAGVRLAPTNGLIVQGNVGIGTWLPLSTLDFGNAVTSVSRKGTSLLEQTISYQPGLLSAVNANIGVYGKFVNASTVDNFVCSAVTFSCISNPTITEYECATSTSCTSPTTISSSTVTSGATAFPGSISSSAIAAGDYVGFAMTSGTCASIDVACTSQVHSN